MAAIALSAKLKPVALEGRHILRLTTNIDLPPEERANTAVLLTGENCHVSSKEFSWRISIGTEALGALTLPQEYDYLGDGDIVRLQPSIGDFRVLYRKNSPHNVLFVTEQCNSRCVMCSQPPREMDDSYLIEEILKAIPLMSTETSQLCITGGEPTLNFKGLLSILESVKAHLPNTSLHMLSNGRSFKNPANAKEITAIHHPDFMIGIPLYADLPSQHDFVVQSKGAFDETISGLLNLAAYRQRVEIRFVIHRQTVSRMAATAYFIARNLPFVSHVALMGFEPTGYGKTNLEALWIDPWEYRDELEEAVKILREAGLKVSIYNHQLCTLPQQLWAFASKSISDWKNVFMPECSRCLQRDQCAGFFSSNRNVYSKHIHAL